MTTAHLSSDLFAIAEESGIPLRGRADRPIGDRQYDAFCREYGAWARQRDASLKAHLKRSPYAFRALIPYSPRAFRLAYQVQWYFDEILVRDPVAVLLGQRLNETQHDDRKIQLGLMLKSLATLHPALEAGSLVLYGQGARDEPAAIDREQLENLSKQPEIVRALTEAIRWGLEARAADDGREWHVFQAALDTGLVYGWHAETLEGESISPAIRVGEQLLHATQEQVESVLGRQTVEGVQSIFPVEIEGTLNKFAVANSMSAVPLFDREVDGLIVQAAIGLPERAFTQIGALNLTLPYLEGIPANALVELRKKDPDAFAQLRLVMNDLVRRAQADELSEPLEQMAAREIVPRLHGLEAEFSALRRTRRYSAAIGTASLAVGVLAGILLGPAGATLGGAAVPATHSFLDTFLKEGALTSNPFYWLWRVRQ